MARLALNDDATYDDDYIDLRKLAASLLRRWWIIVSATLLAVAGAYLFTNMQTPTYEASTTLFIKDLHSVGEHMFLEGGSGAAPRNRVQNSVQLLRSRQVAERTVARLGPAAAEAAGVAAPEATATGIEAESVATGGSEVDAPPLTGNASDSIVLGVQKHISVQPVSGTETVRIVVQHTDPEMAAAIANAAAAGFIELSYELNQAEVRAARRFIEEQLHIAEGQLHEAEQRLRTAERQLGADQRPAGAEQQAAGAEQQAGSVEQQTVGADHQPGFENAGVSEVDAVMLRRLELEQSVLEQSYLLLRRRYEDARIAEAMRSPDVAVIDRAWAPTRPIGPRRLLNLALGAFLGMFLGVGAALMLEFFDTTFTSPEEVEAALGLPVLGRIPLEKVRNGR